MDERETELGQASEATTRRPDLRTVTAVRQLVTPRRRPLAALVVAGALTVASAAGAVAYETTQGASPNLPRSHNAVLLPVFRSTGGSHVTLSPPTSLAHSTSP